MPSTAAVPATSKGGKMEFGGGRACAIIGIWLVIGAVILVPQFANHGYNDYISTSVADHAITAALITTVVIALSGIRIGPFNRRD